MASMIKLDRNLAEELRAAGGGAYKCYQCGTCTGDCPVAWLNNEFNPRKLVLFASFGIAEPLKSNIPWICSTCYKCTTRCPRDVKPSEVLSAMRKLTIRENLTDNEGVRFVRAFANVVKENGELSETKLVIKLKGFAGSLRMLPPNIAWKMFKKGKISLREKKAPCVDEVREIFEVAGGNNGNGRVKEA